MRGQSANANILCTGIEGAACTSKRDRGERAEKLLFVSRGHCDCIVTVTGSGSTGDRHVVVASPSISAIRRVDKALPPRHPSSFSLSSTMRTPRNQSTFSKPQMHIQALDERERPVRRPEPPTQKSRPKPDTRLGRDHRLHGVAKDQACCTRHHSRADWIDSSARLESVALVENTDVDVY